MVFYLFEGDVGEAGDDEDELEGGFPFAKSIRCEDDSLLHGNLPKPCDHKLSADDRASDPDGAESF